MAYIYKKRVGDKAYYYLRASKRQGNRIIAKDIAYLGNTIDEVRASLAKLPAKNIRPAYKTIGRFLESNTWLKQAQTLKLKSMPFVDKSLLEQVEACRLHWQNVFQKRDHATKKDYFQKFSIEFAFNTTSIEGNTITLKEAERLLLEQLTPKNKTLREIYDVQNTERVFFNIINDLPEISHETSIKIHSELMKNIDARIGYRTEDVHVIHAHFASTPAQYVKTDINLLLQLYKKNTAKLHPLALGGIFHHKFEKIHPFFDGNGRTGRMLLNTILLRSKYPPLIVRKRNRAAYLDALSRADHADLTKITPEYYKKLIEFLAIELIETYWNNFL